MANRLNPRQQVAKFRKRHPKSGKFIPQGGNGHAQGPHIPIGISSDLARVLRPQAAFRWILPNVAAITPSYIEMVMRGALAGNHVQQWELFDLMMDTWPELSACYQELVYGVLSKKLVFEPNHEEDAPPEPDAIERMKLVSCALRNMAPTPDRDESDLQGCIKDLLDGWVRGITVQEIVWWPSQGNEFGTIMSPRSTFWVHPVCYGFNADGVLGLRTVSDQSPGGLSPNKNYGVPSSYPYSYLSAQPQPAVLQPFPDHKFLIGIQKAKSGTALGGPLLRPLAWWWVAANFSADWLLNLAQLFGLPFRWATYDPNAPDKTIEAIQQMLQNMGSAGYAAFPSGTEMNFMETGGGRQAEYSPQGTLMDRADRMARLLVLGQTMTGNTMTSGKGGQAFGVVEKDVKQERIDAAGKYACDVINKQLIRSILLLNYGDDNNMPRVRLLEENEGQFVDAQRDQILKNIGIPLGVDFMRKKYGIPEPAEGEEVLEQTMPEPPGTETPEEKLDGNGNPIQPNESQPAMEQGDKAMESASGAYAPGHPFFGNRFTSQFHGPEFNTTERTHPEFISEVKNNLRHLDRFPQVRAQLRKVNFNDKSGASASISYRTKTEGGGMEMNFSNHAAQAHPSEFKVGQSVHQTLTDDLPGTVRHEIGHMVHATAINNLDEQGKSELYDLAKSAPKVSEYSGKNAHEAVAENFDAYLSGNATPETNDFVKKFLSKGKIQEVSAKFPSITHSGENERRLLQNQGVQTKEAPPQVINVHVDAPVAAAPVNKTFTITRADGTVIEGQVKTE